MKKFFLRIKKKIKFLLIKRGVFYKFYLKKKKKEKKRKREKEKKKLKISLSLFKLFILVFLHILSHLCRISYIKLSFSKIARICYLIRIIHLLSLEYLL
jgi:hypothetical protein